MPESFVSMKEWLTPPPVLEPEPVPMPREENDDDSRTHVLITDYDCAEVRRFRAALQDVLLSTAHDLLKELACDVLGRELNEPCDLPAIVTRCIERYAIEPLRVRVHPLDVEQAAACGYPVIADENLRPGDAMLELKHGSIDARLGVRLERVLAAVAL